MHFYYIIPIQFYNLIFLEYQGDLISPLKQYNDTTFVKQTIQVCV